MNTLGLLSSINKCVEYQQFNSIVTLSIGVGVNESPTRLIATLDASYKAQVTHSSAKPAVHQGFDKLLSDLVSY